MTDDISNRVGFICSCMLDGRYRVSRLLGELMEPCPGMEGMTEYCCVQGSR